MHEAADLPTSEDVSAPVALSVEERIARHARMANSYHDAYAHHAVKDGATYDEWVFAPTAVYSSPYFGSEVIELANHPISVHQSATMEALAYSVRFSGWGPVDFQSWPSPHGFAMKTRFEGQRADGVTMGFYAYGFVQTDQFGRITRWETHVSREYDDFLDVAIGVHGPFSGQAGDYLEALSRTLKEAGVDLPQM